MKKQMKIVTTAWLISLVVTFGGWSVVAAQDVTLEAPTQEVITATAPAPTETSTAESTDEPTKEPEKPLFSTVALGELLLFLGLAALAGGGIVAIVLGFLGKKEVRDRVEDARNSWTPEQQKMLADFTAGLQRMTDGVLDFLKAVQDGQPNEVIVAQVMQSPQMKAQVKAEVADQMGKPVG